MADSPVPPDARQGKSSVDWTSEVRQRLASLPLSPTRENEIVEELSAHLDDRCNDLVAAGASLDEARRHALADFRDGDVLAKYIATLRQARVPPSVSPGASAGRLRADILQTFRYATRILWKPPGLAVVAVLTLALGIGATTAIFSVVYGVLLKPLPFPNADRLVALYHVTPATPTDIQSAATYFTYRERGRVFEDVGLWSAGTVSVVQRGIADEVPVLRVTDGTLSLLGVHAELGRLFTREDDVPGAPQRVVLTNGYWRDAFAASSDVIGQSLVINTRPAVVIGVLPASFKLLNTDPALVLPLGLNPANATTGALGFNGVARLKPDVTLAQANADVARMIPLLTEKFPLMPGLTQQMWDAVELAPNLRPLSEAAIGDMGRPLWILLGTIAVVLLMAWTNVANLLLVRAEGRRREFAIRGALGASRVRIATGLLSESVMLGLAGFALGVLFAQVCVMVLRRMAPMALPRVDDIRIDAVVLLVALAISLVTSLLFGLIAALRSGAFTTAVFKEVGRSTTDTPDRHHTRHVLIVAQVGFALVLLVVSGLMARTFVALRQVQPGFVRPADVQSFDINLRPALIPDPEQATRTIEHIAERLKQVPGVEAVGTGRVDMTGVAGKSPVYIQGRPVAGLPPIRSIRVNGVGYFETMNNPVVAGRTFTWADVSQAKPVVLISENLAREYWDTPAQAVGNRVGVFEDGPWNEIVGVVGNERIDGVNHPAPPIVYFPMTGVRSPAYVVRSTRAGTSSFVRELRQAVWSVNANVPLANMRTLDDVQADSMAQTSFALVMLAISASVALLLALVGVYGVVSYIAAERTREIGIRMALGAQVGDVRRLFLRHGLMLTFAGVVLGLSAALALTPVMASLLYGVRPNDPVTYASVALMLAAVTLLATYLPARRASRVSPVVAMRSDV